MRHSSFVVQLQSLRFYWLSFVSGRVRFRVRMLHNDDDDFIFVPCLLFRGPSIVELYYSFFYCCAIYLELCCRVCPVKKVFVLSGLRAGAYCQGEGAGRA
jgi:hypothetical protein